MPVDAEPHPEGNLKLWRGRETRRLTVTVTNVGGAKPLFRPHFATCPDAKKWRR